MMQVPGQGQGLVDRMMRAAKIDIMLYREVEQDLGATSQAFTVVVIGGASTGIGVGAGLALAFQNPVVALLAVIAVVAMAVLGWAVWSFLTYFVGTRLFDGTATYGELLRTLGFAYSPHALGVVNIIPCVGPVVGFGLSIWSLVAGVVAVREALNFDTGKAIATVVIGWIIMLVMYAVIWFALFSTIMAAMMGGRRLF